MYSLFEEQITFDSLYVDHYLRNNTNSFAESLSYFPEMDSYNVWPDEYLNLIRRAKESVDIPIIGSLNGVSIGGWTNYAGLIEDAGADALELNIYYVPTSLEITGREVEDIYVDMLRQVKQAVTIPVAIKLSPFFSSVSNMAQRLVERGANGLVFFNRFYQPDFDLEALAVAPQIGAEQLTRDCVYLYAGWRFCMDGFWRISPITTGVHTSEDVLKGLMAGAKVTMMASELLQNGVRRIKEVLREVEIWMDEHEYGSVRADDWQHEPATLRGTSRVRARELHESAGFLPARELIWSAATRRRFGRTLDLLPISILCFGANAKRRRVAALQNH
jgi:dihydroorotate dehydrogenase (fumarate)